jgi:hypothetical protein
MLSLFHEIALLHINVLLDYWLWLLFEEGFHLREIIEF